MTNPTSSSDPARTPPHARRRLIKGLMLGGAMAVSFLAGGLTLSGASAAAMQMAEDHMGMMGHGGMAHGGHGQGDMHAMMRGHLEHMLSAADATPDQKARIEQILKGAMGQVGPLHAKLMTTPRDLHHLLMAPVVDRAALEQLRASRVADLDQGTRVMVQALADAAEVLSPAQRARLGAAMAHHHEAAGHGGPHG